MPRKRSITTVLVFFCIFLAPSVLKLFPHTDAVVEASTWVAEMVIQGLASFSLFIAVAMACSLASDAYRWLTGATAEPTTPTPAQLEDGTTATPLHDLAILEAEVAGAKPPAPDSSSSATESDTQRTTAGDIIALIGGSAFFAYEFAQREVVSLDKSWLENVGAGLLFILRGFEVIFGLALLLMFGAWVTRSRSGASTATAPAAPVEVLFEGTLPEEEMMLTTEKV
ncbi:hypothetical protein C8F04DRAFT_1114201 [Mycena alexandri]|uniref:Uncharacterized protein n=1 Tax=Mycena alexandri TaxID=1745969 RepID=A0AAD6SLT2_9AGAR|nr:hypothetical protein C8F04DRAFT_1114201 [Mycena alexandri]